jgi:hypothetical protein
MGFQALLPDGEVISPAVDVLDGLLTPQQANATYRGTTGTCPHCQQMREQQAGTDNWRVLSALAAADLTVRYRSASIDQCRMTRVMHFAHKAGFLESQDSCLLCRNGDLAHHAKAVKVIGRWAQKQWPSATVKAEMQVVTPGTPPTLFRPDISVTSADGSPIACIEYQRTPEGFQAFTARDSVRLKEFPQVLWFFAQGAYGKSGQHRDYLDDRSRTFYRCWVDGETARLMHDEGRRRAERPKEPKDRILDNCSESTLLRTLDRPEQASSRGGDWINGSLELGEKPTPPAAAATRPGLFRSLPQPFVATRYSLPKTPDKKEAPLMTVTERVELALANGMTAIWDIRAFDWNRHSLPLHANEIKRALRAIGNRGAK